MNITKKARSAAKWCRNEFESLSFWETIHGKWTVYEQVQPIGNGRQVIHEGLSPSMLIAFAEDRGWQGYVPDKDGMSDNRRKEVGVKEQISLDEAIAEIEKLRQDGLDCREFTQPEAYLKALAILARVAPNEEDQAIMWLMREKRWAMALTDDGWVAYTLNKHGLHYWAQVDSPVEEMKSLKAQSPSPKEFKEGDTVMVYGPGGSFPVEITKIDDSVIYCGKMEFYSSSLESTDYPGCFMDRLYEGVKE